jgi:hypothetical protein
VVLVAETWPSWMDCNDVAAGEGILCLSSSSSAASYRGVSFRDSKGVFSWESFEWREAGRSEPPSSGAASALLSVIVEELVIGDGDSDSDRVVHPARYLG